MKPICVPCRRFYRCVEGGYYFIEGMPNGPDVAPGNVEPENWKPYKVWAGDRWRCPDCGAEIISGTGAGPISEHYKHDFASIVERLNASQFQVNDC